MQLLLICCGQSVHCYFVCVHVYASVCVCVCVVMYYNNKNRMSSHAVGSE